MNQTTNPSLPPFSLYHSPELPELFQKLNCTLVMSTYQAGKVIFLNAANENSLVMLPRTFNKAMGIAIEGSKMAIATKDEVILLSDVPELGQHYPKQPGKYKHLYVPRATYYTGNVDIHDLHFGIEGLWGVNSSFSCLCLINEEYSFIPKWKPSFITELVSEDRCHLNGLVMLDGKPKYVTSLGTGNSFQSWRKEIIDGGVLLDVETNEIILQNLAMPHSPTFHQGDLYLLLSAKGEVIRVDLKNKNYEVIKQIDGFTRGMAILGDYMFIGMSKLRQNSSTFSKLPFATKAQQAGVKILHLPTRSIVGEMNFHTSVEEIYDLQLLPNISEVGILNAENALHKQSLSIPGSSFWAKIPE